MGADSTVVFYGVRFATTDAESDGLQNNSDARIVQARKHGLDHWWGTFSLDYHNEQHYLFIGKLFGNVGHEGVYELTFDASELQFDTEQTKSKLHQAGFTDIPLFFIQFEPDF